MHFLKFVLPLFCLYSISCKDSTPNQEIRSQVDILASHMHTTIHPGDDFFEYANGGWLKKNPIPSSENGWGIFNLVADENYQRIKKISEDASAMHGKEGSAAQQIGDFFFSGMDSVGIETLDIAPLKATLSKIDSIRNTEQIIALVSWMQENGASPLFDMYIGQDLMNSDKNRLYLSQGGLGLPDRDYYFNTDTRTKNIREEYLKHIQNMLYLIESDSVRAKADAKAIMNLESSMASIHKKLEDLRDPYANYHKMSVASLERMTSKLKWSAIFAGYHVEVDSIIVGQPAFFTKINAMLSSHSLADWKSYLKWHLLSTFSPYLSSRFDKEHFHFYSEILRGAKEQRPRWKRVLDAQENALGDALGQLFVKEYFPDKTKKRYEDLVAKIVDSYREHIQKLDWMTDSTKQKAIVKLNSITRKIGYPNKWKDYSNMKISRNNYCQNIIAANSWTFQYEFGKLAKPVDRSEWGMTPDTYNAYYNPSNNEIVLPAAIFTAPGYSDDEVDDAVIYGYVGASTIGHELTHGFDDQGRQFDEKGNLKNWWSKADEINFNKRADLLVKQFNLYTVLDSLHPNGSATLGENIADLGGVVIALDAFKKTKQYKEGKLIAGLTPLQRYFMGYAYGWMQTRRPEMLATQLLTDVHAPIFLRVIAPMSNCDDWYQAFDVKANHKQYKDSLSRVRIW